MFSLYFSPSIRFGSTIFTAFFDVSSPDWDLPAEAIQSGLETLRSHLELVQGNTSLLYEMT